MKIKNNVVVLGVLRKCKENIKRNKKTKMLKENIPLHCIYIKKSKKKKKMKEKNKRRRRKLLYWLCPEKQEEKKN